MSRFAPGIDVEIIADGAPRGYRLIDDPETGARAVEIVNAPRLGPPTEPGVMPVEGAPFLYQKVWDRFDGGMGDRRGMKPGAYYFGNRVKVVGQSIKPDRGSAFGGAQHGASRAPRDPQGDRGAIFTTSANEVFAVMGRTVWSPITGLEDRDFGNGVLCQTVESFGGAHYFGFGGTANVFQERTSGGSWANAAAGLYASFFAVSADGRLWRAYETANNKALVSNCFTGPTQSANWSAGITVGDPGVPITGLATMGPFVFIGKEDGLYAVNSDGDCFNMTPEIAANRHPDNGRNMMTWKGIVFYPTVIGLYAYDGSSVWDASPSRDMDGDDGENPVSGQALVLAGTARSLYGMFEARMQPQKAVPTEYFRQTTDGGVTYPTSRLLGTFDNVPFTKFFYVGHTERFSAVVFNMLQGNANISGLVAQIWTGSSWTDCPIVDGTRDRGATLSNKNGTVIMKPNDASAWQQLNLGGTTAYWVRFRVSANLSSNTEIGLVRIVPGDLLTTQSLTADPTVTDNPATDSHLYEATLEDGRLIWQARQLPAYGGFPLRPMAMTITRLLDPHRAVTRLVMLSPYSQNINLIRGHVVAINIDPQIEQQTALDGDNTILSLLPRWTPSRGHLWLSETTMGYPEHVKIWDRFVTQFRAGTGGYVRYAHRLDGANAFTAIADNAHTDGGRVTLFPAGTTGRRLMTRITLEPPIVLEQVIVRAHVRPPVGSVVTLRFSVSDNERGRTSDQIVSELEALAQRTSTVTLRFEGTAGALFGGTAGALTVLPVPQTRIVQQRLNNNEQPQWVVEQTFLVQS